jgi:hypothetical protein
MYDRLLHTYDITRRTILMRWARERYPDFLNDILGPKTPSMLCGGIIWNGVNDKKKFHHSMRHNEETCSKQTANLVGIGYPLFLTLWLAVVSVVVQKQRKAP